MQSPEGEASCAEVEIVRLLREAHWEAGWFQEFAPKLVTSAWRPALVERVNLPANIQQRHDRIRARMGRQGGCWDVIAWKDDAVWYLESKGPRDGLTRNQVAWWVAAAEVDPAIGFALVEWRMRAKGS